MPDKTPTTESPVVCQAGTIRGARAAPPPCCGTECPIEVMYEENFNQRRLCTDMELLAATTWPRPELARRILVNLCRDQPAHFEDDARGLFPRLRARALPMDGLDKTLSRLAHTHEAAHAAFVLLIPALACMAGGDLPGPGDRDALYRLAAAERRHLIVENAILLPLARLRLSDADKSALMAGMRARRRQPRGTDFACARVFARLDLLFPGGPE
ncbi:hemerythrin domain-containing protein [Roseinatronobacter alkalisoli]|uniref:Hemerythrin domain-containing protein n=1 Tax=Roseinatronobacter alkalisoli TaxID=3028235 RepID=A0ABT5TB26_9RHOB|nr:hemerythrin domain-containing protein [Roseinatronobacter sp. HJB301]MDD7972325.1 hemerythrin domain-containing protein [Roseinatronobacter sp. HJB301]